MKQKVHCRVHTSPPPVSTLSPTPLIEDPLKYYPPIYAQVFQVVSFPKISPPKPCMYLREGLLFNKIVSVFMFSFLTSLFDDMSSILWSTIGKCPLFSFQRMCPRHSTDYRERQHGTPTQHSKPFPNLKTEAL